jgi:arylsulfatase A-like enzyme
MLDSHPLLKHRAEEIRAKKLPNILLILVDDLGYGDTSVAPFTSSLRPGMDWLCSETGGFLTTHLETLAQQGLRMTNMHSAAPVCSPSRASLLTGIAAWRLGALNAFELGQDLSQRNGFLAQIPTLPGALREAGYYTAHSGKWHLGGMRQEYIEARERNDVCTNPGPNQAGFEDYVSMLDGPGTPRYTLLLRDPTNLHTNGHK